MTALTDNGYGLRGLGAELDIFEASGSIGGNCYTCGVEVGSFGRWTDLAVNDFNAPMYAPVVAAMNDLGVRYAPLEDTASFFRSDGSLVYTLDGGWGTPAPKGFAELYSVFAARAYDVLNSKAYANVTVAEFLRTEPPFAQNPAFGATCILPRVNAMYFCAPEGPGAMPIQTAYLYYYFQEGFGTGNYASPGSGGGSMLDRQYFVDGASSFIAALARKAAETGTNVFTGAPAKVTGAPGAWYVTQGAVAEEGGKGKGKAKAKAKTKAPARKGPYAQVVFACHADQAAAAFPGASPDVTAMLRRVRYAPSTAYAHLDESLLPKPSARRTYNVLVRSPQEKQEYAMTYVINHHQADQENTVEGYFDCPQYYVSLNPQRVPNKILTDNRRRQPAVAPFFHNVGDPGLRAAQDILGRSGLQGRDGIFFIGGWTTGAGLMIECWKSIDPVLAMLHGHADVPLAGYGAAPEEEHYAPAYVRDARPPRTAPMMSRAR
jgi:predicted NAD/FAD-binding protein